MRLRTLAVTVGALVLLAGIVWLAQWQLGKAPAAKHSGHPLLDQVDLTQAARVEVIGPTSRATLLAGPEGWTVQEQDGFPADQGKLSSLLLKLSEQKAGDLVSSSPADFADLGVLTQAENANKLEARKTCTLLRILDAAGKPLFELLIGNDRQLTTTTSAFGGQYVRFPGEQAAYLIGTTILADSDGKDWIEKPVLASDADKQFKRMHVQPPGKRAYAFVRDDPKGQWRLEGAPQQALLAPEVDTLAKNLADLEINSVAQAGSTPAALGRAKTGSVEVTTFDGRDYRLALGADKTKDSLRYVSTSAVLRPAKASTAPAAAPPAAGPAASPAAATAATTTPPAAAAPLTEQDLKKRVDSYNNRFGKRFVAIQDWDGSRLMRDLKDYLPKPAAKQPAAKQPPEKPPAAKAPAAKAPAAKQSP